MSQLNFKKMYLISCEKYDTLKTTSAQTNNSSSPVLPTSQIADNSGTERVIDLEVRSSSQQTKRVANSNDEGIFAKRKKMSSLENKIVPDVPSFKCHGMCASKEKLCHRKDCKASIVPEANNYPNICKMTKGTQTEGVCSNYKTRPQFRKTFTRIYKSKRSNTKDTELNNNRKRYREPSDTDTPDIPYVLKGKRKKYSADHSISSKMNTNRNLASSTNQEQKSSKKRWLKLL